MNDKDEEFTEPKTKPKRKFDKWTTIMALGMSGLSLMVWIATVILKP